MTNNKKGQGLPIGTLVVIALAVFVLFLVIGFVTAGWGFFAERFGIVRETAGDLELATTRCSSWCASWQSAGQPELTSEDRPCKLYNDLDLNGDGTIDITDEYSCRDETAANVILTHSQCPATCP